MKEDITVPLFSSRGLLLLLLLVLVLVLVLALVVLVLASMLVFVLVLVLLLGLSPQNTRREHCKTHRSALQTTRPPNADPAKH